MTDDISAWEAAKAKIIELHAKLEEAVAEEQRLEPESERQRIDDMVARQPEFVGVVYRCRKCGHEYRAEHVNDEIDSRCPRCGPSKA